MAQAHRLSTSLKALLLGAACLSGVPCAWGQSVTTIHLGDLMGRRFIANEGQWAPEVRFAAGWGASRAWVGPGTLSLQTHDHEGRAATIRLVPTSAAPWTVRGLDLLAGEHHFIRGSDPWTWIAHVSAYGTVALESPGDGLRLHVLPLPRGLELQLEIEPWAPSREIVLEIEGAVPLRGDDGSLRIETNQGCIQQSCRVCGAGLGSQCSTCRGGLRLDVEGSLRWSGPSHDEAGTTSSIGLEWSTLLSGSLREAVTGVAFASDGSVVVAGHSSSQDFPTTPGAFDPTHAPPHPQFFNKDLFVARITADGSELVYSTFVGGEGNDSCHGLVLTDVAEPVVLAWTGSFGYPTTRDAFAPEVPFPTNAAVSRLLADGSALVFSTFLGGSMLDVPNGIALTADGGIVVVGTTDSPEFPVTPGAFDTEFGPGRAGFVSKLTADGKALMFSTFLGNGGYNSVDAVSVFPDGSVVVAGEPGVDFPITRGGLQTEPGGSFLSRLSADGSQLLWSTFFGGTASNNINDLAVDATGVITAVGTVFDMAPPTVVFPTTEGAFDPTYNGSYDAFVTRIDPTGSRILTSTFVAGGHQDEAWDVFLDPGGVATIAGKTRSDDFPATDGAYDTTHNGDWDLFAARLSPESDRLFYATFLGGSFSDPDQSGQEIDVAVGPDGEVVIVSMTLSTDYPTTPGTFETEDGPFGDGVVSKLTMLPAGVEGLGTQTPGCAGSLPIGVTAMPQIGSSSFGLWSSGAEPFARFGLLGLARRPLESPLLFEGIDLWLDPGLLIALPVASDALGYGEVRLPIPNLPLLEGKRFWAQFFWSDSCGVAGWAATRALEITIQPPQP